MVMCKSMNKPGKGDFDVKRKPLNASRTYPDSVSDLFASASLIRQL